MWITAVDFSHQRVWTLGTPRDLQRPLDLSEPEDLGESGPFEERSAPRTKADLLREIRQRADRRTGQQEAEQRQIDPWQAQPPQRRGHGR